MPRRALFLDRDGVINRDDGYVHRREDFHFLPGIFDLAAAATRQGLLLCVVTNQSGIGRGLYTEGDYQALMAWVAGEFAARGTPLADIRHCPDLPGTPSGRRKPAPGMLLEAAAALRLDLPASILVGDKATDILAARAAGLGDAVLVTADAAEAARAPAGTRVLPDVAAAAAWLDATGSVRDQHPREELDLVADPVHENRG